MIPGNGSWWATVKFVVTLPVALAVQAFYLLSDKLRAKLKKLRRP